MGESTSKGKKGRFKPIETGRIEKGANKLQDFREWVIKNPSKMLDILEQPQRRQGWQYEASLKDYEEKGKLG